MGLEGQGNETGGEVQSSGGQASSTGVPSSQAPQASASAQGSTTQQQQAAWKARIGDTDYDESAWKTKGVEDFRKLHGEYTRSRQESARLRDESGAGLELLEMVKGDPGLMAEVQRRLNKGQSPEQAVNGAVQNDPRIDTLYKEVDGMKQEKASQAFRAKHPDMSKEDEAGVIEWIQMNSDRLKNAGWGYQEILDQAWVNVYAKNGEKKAADALVQGQRMEQEAVQKGRKGQLLGAPSPTAQTSGKKVTQTLHLNPAQRLDVAMDKFQANKRKG